MTTTITDAAVEAVVQAVRPYTLQTLFIEEHRELVRAALQAAAEHMVPAETLEVKRYRISDEGGLEESSDGYFCDWPSFRASVAAAKREGIVDRPEGIDANDILETISDNLRTMESWAEGKTLTVMFDDEEGARRFAKLRLVRILDKPSPADLKGEPE